MDASQQIVLDSLLSSEKGEILKRNGEEIKKLKIGDKTYNFERNKPITNRLKTKFNKIRQTMDYKRYELKEKRGIIRWINLDKNKALTGIQKRYKATITDEQSAFKNYTSSYAITKGVDSSTQLKLNHDLNRYHQIHFNLSLPGVNSRFNPFCCWIILGGLNSDLILC